MLCAGRLLGGVLKDFVRVNPRVFSMAAEKLSSVPEVEIDPEGTFKYVLIKVYGSTKSSDAQDVKTIVRGFKSGKFHGPRSNEIKVLEAPKRMKLELEIRQLELEAWEKEETLNIKHSHLI